MNWDQVEGSWKQFTGKVRSKWGELTDDEVAEARGDRDRLEGMIQEKYGTAKDKIHQELDAILNDL